MKRVSKIIFEKKSADFKEQALSWAQQYDDVVFLESNTASQIAQQTYKDFDAALAIGAHTRIAIGYKNAFSSLKDFQSSCRDYLFGYLSYDLKNDIEDLHSAHEDHLGFDELFFFQPEKVLIWKGTQVAFLYMESVAPQIETDIVSIRRTSVSKKAVRSGLDIKARISKKSYVKKVSNILDHIHRGDIYEVNFCQEFYAKNAVIAPLEVYLKLNDISEAPFASYIKLRDKYLLCASPERFAKKKGDQVIVQPIKGTARRITDAYEDQRLADMLAKDPKERAENIMIVDLIRNDLSKSAEKGTVQVEELCKVYSFKQVHQLISTVSSKVGQSVHGVDIIKDLFPMGSMTGAPKISAMKIIEEEEETKRGLYSGAVGYFSPNGDFDFNVVIRSLLYNATKQYVSFSVGSAITAQSEIENEYEECLLKARALRQALGA